MDFIKFLLLGIVMLAVSIYTIISSILFWSIASIILILLSIVFLIASTYCILSALTLKIGATHTATIINKDCIEYDKGKNTLSYYYKFTYEVAIKDDEKIGQFRLYEKDRDVIDMLDTGDTISVRALGPIIKVSTIKIIVAIRNKPTKDE